MQQPEAIQRVNVFRPPEYFIGPEAQPEIAESMLNRYRMVVQPLFFDEQRCSFQLRAPGLGVLCSRNMFIEASFKIRCPGRLNFATSKSAIAGIFDNNVIEPVGDPGANEVQHMGYGAKIAFGGGDAITGAVSNIQLVVNGAAISNSRQRTYTNALDRVWFADDVFQRRFSCAGGLPDKHNTVCVSGRAAVGQAETHVVSAFTADSGLEKRCENLLECTVKIDEPLANAAGTVLYDVRTVRVRYPVRACGILSPVGPFDEQADSSPFKASTLAIPHFNTVSIDILFQGLRECLFRNLTRTHGDANRMATLDVRGGFGVELLTTPAPELHAEYIRLGMWNSIPASISLPAYKIAIHDPTKAVRPQGLGVLANQGIVAALTRENIQRNLYPALPCVGYSRTDGTGRCAPFDGGKYIECDWNITSAQIASYLFFVMQKSSDVYVLGNKLLPTDAMLGAGAPQPQCDDSLGKRISTWDYAPGAPGNARSVRAGQENYFLARNTNACAAIQRFSLEIMSSQGSYTYSSDNYPYLKDRHELFRDVLRHTVPSYLNGDINRWRKHCCIVILSSSDFARGLSVAGASFPVQYSAKCQFASEREFISGTGAASTAATTTGAAVLRDCIYGQPVMGEIFDKAELRLSPSSGIVSSMNISHATGMSLLSRGGAQ